MLVAILKASQSRSKRRVIINRKRLKLGNDALTLADGDLTSLRRLLPEDVGEL